VVRVKRYCHFFFFQAEDGIRDGHVTGVQTCALPISFSTSSGCARRRPRGRSSASNAPTSRARRHSVNSDEYSPSRRSSAPISPRSEERRVGKEGRSQRLADASRKKIM